ncbi:hypothetical protein SteCoe_22812 [Stentor coeruleus]|uniref:Reticulon domain-containing protein n=1 Tax=Stentor coeruleus TaxID=5963 RepID=A0A1R2BLG9_9CILI|nr:hypothetical protein SteCoe_22812 [Stentor coeruleus]
MACMKYPNNACCKYLTWENIPLTGTLCVIENLIFTIIWAYDIQIISLFCNIAIAALCASIICKIIGKDSCLQCSSCHNCENSVKKLYERLYDKINESFDWFRKNATGPKALVLIFLCYILEGLNLTLFEVAWVIALWSFIKPALVKFAGIDVCELCKHFCEENPIKEKLHFVLGMIPKASCAGKKD